MTFQMPTESGVLSNKKFVLFLFSQGVSNLGDAFQFIAVTSLIINITGSGLSAAFGLVCSPVLSILFSSLGGYVSDVKTEKALLILIDFLRGLVVILFIAKYSILEIYILVVILSILDIFYNPPRRKLMTGILRNHQLMAGNSHLNGLSGGMFIIGSMLAGIVVSKCGTNIAFFINSMSFFISSFIITIIRYKTKKSIVSSKTQIAIRQTSSSFFNGFIYCLNSYSLRKVIFIATVLCFATTSVNIAFYPFAFDVLKISNKVWGTMISIFYGANLIAMPLALLANYRTKTYYKVIIPLLLAIIATIWFSYGNTNKIGYIFILQLVEGTILSYLNILLTSHLQMKSKKDILGRVIGVNDFITNAGKILGIGFTYTMLKIARPNMVFLFCAFILFAFSAYVFVSIKVNRLEAA